MDNNAVLIDPKLKRIMKFLTAETVFFKFVVNWNIFWTHLLSSSSSYIFRSIKSFIKSISTEQFLIFMMSGQIKQFSNQKGRYGTDFGYGGFLIRNISGYSPDTPDNCFFSFREYAFYWYFGVVGTFIPSSSNNELKWSL